jgi:hypothetical protein
MVMMAMAGATTQQIAVISGHAVDRMQAIIDTYLPRRGEVRFGAIEVWRRVRRSCWCCRVSTGGDEAFAHPGRKQNVLELSL